ncbi:MAG: organic hydroperoxide resistance protein [Actinomycetota bacterium]|jgi:osmotically inducible protein OsmC|nr:organic hydroperoxide resistance protein [Actinomycetota bacterium]
MQPIYTAEATAYGARTGTVVTNDGRLDLTLSRPSEMGGDGGSGTNPEQLFAAGYAACFHSAMRFALKPEGLTASALQGSKVAAKVHFLKAGEGEFGLGVDLDVHLPEVDEEQARKVAERTHQICPYSKAIRDNVDVHINIV